LFDEFLHEKGTLRCSGRRSRVEEGVLETPQHLNRLAAEGIGYGDLWVDTPLSRWAV